MVDECSIGSLANDCTCLLHRLFRQAHQLQALRRPTASGHLPSSLGASLGATDGDDGFEPDGVVVVRVSDFEVQATALQVDYESLFVFRLL